MENNVIRPNFSKTPEHLTSPSSKPTLEDLRLQHPEGVPVHLLAEFMAQTISQIIDDN